MSVFERNLNNEGAIYDLGLLNAIRDGAGLPKLAGDTTSEYATGENSFRVLYSAKDSGGGQVSLPIFKSDMTPYDSILVRAYVKGTSQYDSAGIKKSGFLSLSLVTMSKNWTWRERSIGATVMDKWSTYGIPFSSNAADTNKALVPADPAAIDFFALQAYSHGFRGAIYVDWIVFKSKNGTSDTVYTFNERAPKDFNGNVDTIQLFPVADVPADKKWETATTTIWNSTSIKRRTITCQNDMQIIAFNGTIRITGSAKEITPATVTLIDLQGRTLWSHVLKNIAGTNELKAPSHQSGPVILQIHQGTRDLVRKLISLY
jgi:hypothetical protein